MSKESFMKSMLGNAIAAVGIFALAASPARAEVHSIQVVNKSVHPAWITLYAACGSTCAFTIIGGGWGAFCLQPGKSHYYPGHGAIGEVKIRAQVMLRNDCKGPNISDSYDVRTGPSHLVAWVVQESEHRIYVKVVNH